jgi:hypothetical protein
VIEKSGVEWQKKFQMLHDLIAAAASTPLFSDLTCPSIHLLTSTQGPPMGGLNRENGTNSPTSKGLLSH